MIDESMLVKGAYVRRKLFALGNVLDIPYIIEEDPNGVFKGLGVNLKYHGTKYTLFYQVNTIKSFERYWELSFPEIWE